MYLWQKAFNGILAEFVLTKKKEEKRKRKEIDLPYLRDANCIIGTTYLDFLMQRANFAKHYKSCTTFPSCCEKQSESDIINSRWYLI